MPARYKWDPASLQYVDVTGRSSAPDQAKIERAVKAALRSSNPNIVHITEQLQAGTITLDEWQRAFRGIGTSPGRVVARQSIRRALDRTLGTTESDAKALAEDLRSGRIDLATWRTGMRELVKDVHVMSAAAAKGGKKNLNASDFGRVGQILAHGPRGGMGQYDYLERFVRHIEAGLPLDGRFLERVRMYVQAGRSTYHVIDSRVHEDKGFDEERSVRHADDSCAGCLAAEQQGWSLIGTLTPIGSRTCLANCRCTMEYRRSAKPKIKAA